MKYLKLFESFKDVHDLADEVLDLFYDFEEAGYNVRRGPDQIVRDRDDWTGNLRSTKLRNVLGDKFIQWHPEVIMQDGNHKYQPQRVVSVIMSKLSYIEELTNETIIKHWNDIDKEVISLIPKIQTRANHLLDIKIIGVMAGWYQLGKASHSDFEFEPYYNSNSKMIGYYDGSYKSEISIDNTSYTTSEIFFIAGQNYADITVSQVQIYNRPLSATEVLQNYNAQKSRFGL